MLNFVQPAFRPTEKKIGGGSCEQRLDPRSLSSASLTALTRACELKINRGTAGDKEYISYILCQLERQRRM